HETAELLVVVARPIEPARDRDRERRVLDERRGRQQPPLERETVEEGLERRSRLPPRADGVDEAGARTRLAAADVREDVARRVVDDEDGPVLDVPPVEPVERAGE